MGEVAMMVAAGPSHLNSGELSRVDVLGVLDEGGNGVLPSDLLSYQAKMGSTLLVKRVAPCKIDGSAPVPKII